MKRILKMGIVLMLMVFLLTGCTNTEYNVKVKEDGSGKVEYKVEYDEEILKNKYDVDLAWVKSFEFLSSVMKVAEENGYSIENIEKDGNTLGYKASKGFNNMTEEFKIQNSVGDDYITITDDTGIQIEKGTFVTKYTQSFTADLQKGGEVINKVKLSYKFPKGIAKSNADKKFSLLSSKLTWELGQYETKKIEYTVYAFNTILIVIIVAVLVVVILVAFVFIKKYKKDKKENDRLAGKPQK